MTATGERRRQASSGSRLDVRALAVYFVLAYALSWAWVFPLAAAHLTVVRGAGWAHPLPGAVRTGGRGGAGDHVDHEARGDT